MSSTSQGLIDTQELKTIVSGILGVNPVSVIQGATGTGKSSLIPAALAYNGLRMGGRGLYNKGRTIVAVPTIASAIGLSERAKKEFPDLIIGYAADATVDYGTEADLVYATAGHVYGHYLRKIRDGKLIQPNEFAFIFVDEVHTGSVENSIIINFWYYILYQRLAESNPEKLPRLVLVTATLGKIIENLIDPQIPKFFYEIESLSPFPKTIQYMEIQKPDLKYYLKKNAVGLAAENVRTYHMTNEDLTGSILVFVSGLAKILKLKELLEDLPNAEILMAYSSMDEQEKTKIFGLPGPDRRKIILATNVIESSVTIPGVAFIFDTMFEKVPKETSIGSVRLIEDWISKQSADQRAGRGGRTRPTIIVRMIPETIYLNDKRFRSTKDLSIDSVPIHTEMLKVINQGTYLKTFEILKGARTEKILKTQDQLSQLGMITMVKGVPTITEIGQFCVSFPLSVSVSRFLWEWFKFTNLPVVSGLIVAGILNEDPSQLFIPKVEDPENDPRKRFVGLDHLETVLNVWNMAEEDLHFDFLLPHNKIVDPVLRNQALTDWCQVNGVSRYILMEIERKVRKCMISTIRMKKRVPLVRSSTVGMAKYARHILSQMFKGKNELVPMDTAIPISSDMMTKPIIGVFYKEIYVPNEFPTGPKVSDRFRTLKRMTFGILDGVEFADTYQGSNVSGKIFYVVDRMGTGPDYFESETTDVALDQENHGIFALGPVSF